MGGRLNHRAWFEDENHARPIELALTVIRSQPESATSVTVISKQILIAPEKPARILFVKSLHVTTRVSSHQFPGPGVDAGGGSPDHWCRVALLVTASDALWLTASTNAAVLLAQTYRTAAVVENAAWAFARWGGDFWLFTGQQSSSVTHYSQATDTSTVV